MCIRDSAYFNWMCQLVFDGRYSKKLSYRRLLKVLHKIEFTYSIPTVSYTHLDVYKRQVRATPKAIKILKEAELEKGEDLSKLEIIRAAGPIDVYKRQVLFDMFYAMRFYFLK